MATLLTEKVIEIGFDIAIRTEVNDISNSFVIVHKTMMDARYAMQLDSLRSRDCLLIADPVDGKFDVCDFDIYDAIISASFAQIDWLKRVLPGKKCFFVNQRLDCRFPLPAGHLGEFRVGYFGSVDNCAHINEIRRYVDIIETPTHSTLWMQKLLQYSFHYAVRPKVDGVFKPFGKGYIAGLYGAPILVGRNEPDAKFLLPDDYPYWVPYGDPAATLDLIRQARDSFLGERWSYASDVMQKISRLASDSTIKSQFVEMILELVERRKSGCYIKPLSNLSAGLVSKLRGKYLGG